MKIQVEFNGESRWVDVTAWMTPDGQIGLTSPKVVAAQVSNRGKVLPASLIGTLGNSPEELPSDDHWIVPTDEGTYAAISQKVKLRQRDARIVGWLDRCGF